jgi:hypothetical protein
VHFVKTSKSHSDTKEPDLVRSVADLIDVLIGQYSTENRILWFRGHEKASWDVSPSIRREYRPEREAEFELRERNFTNRFRARATARQRNLPKYRDYGGWLSLMQHYGLPTRLLDWTRSPLIALYFAVQHLIYKSDSDPENLEKRNLEDAAIWILEPHSLNDREINEAVTPPIEAGMCRDTLRPAFSDKSTETLKVIAAMSSEKDLRMFVQQGCFTIHSDKTPLNHKSNSEIFLRKLTIPTQCVRRLALEIDVCGLRRGDLFPNLAELASELTSRSISDLLS